MNLQIREKVIIVTNGASGIGESISRTLAVEEAYVVIVGQNAFENEQTLEKIQAIGGVGYCIEIELTNQEACEKVVKITMDRYGRIDGLVNNAGDYHSMIQFCLPHLKITKGPIVNIVPIIAFDKYQTLTREWADEFLQYGIRVNTVIHQNNRDAADEIANMATFLMSRRSSQTTGQLVQIG